MGTKSEDQENIEIEHVFRLPRIIGCLGGRKKKREKNEAAADPGRALILTPQEIIRICNIACINYVLSVYMTACGLFQDAAGLLHWITMMKHRGRVRV